MYERVPWKLERASCLLFGVARRREDTGINNNLAHQRWLGGWCEQTS
jgi:hypothetical protein